MFNFIIKFLNGNREQQQQQRQQQQIFSEQYRRAYNKLWIQSLRAYSLS